MGAGTACVHRLGTGPHRTIREILHEIVDALGRTRDPDRALARLDRFLAALPEDLAFFAMLRANTWLLNLIAVVMGSAPRMAEVLEGHPRAAAGGARSLVLPANPGAGGAGR